MHARESTPIASTTKVPSDTRSAITWHLRRPTGAMAGHDAALPSAAAVTRVDGDPLLNLGFYIAVGSRWHWRDRLYWSPQRWREWVTRSDMTTLVLRIDGDVAGFCELDRAEDEVEIALFGVLPAFTGRGLGTGFLADAVRVASADPAVRTLTVHTCELDHPGALRTYQRVGFEIAATTVEHILI